MSRQICRGFIATMVVMTALGLGACKGILDVTLQGRTPADRLNDFTLAKVLVNGVIGDLECGWDLYNAGVSWISDEYEPVSGNLVWRNWAARRISASDPDLSDSTCETAQLGMYQPLQAARFQSEDIGKRLDGWTDAQVPGRAALKATTKAYGGYAYVALGEGFCQASFGAGVVLPPDSALARAEALFGDAMLLAQTSNTTDILNLARVGRARVRLDRGNTAGAAADASLVPPGFKLMITRGNESYRRYNKHFNETTDQLQAALAPYYQHLTVDGVVDPRVPVGGPILNVENLEVFYTTKYSSNASPHRLASYEEAQLILAEAQGGQAAVDIINGLRNEHGLPHYAGGSDAEIQAQIIEERRREFFAEGGIRLNDLLRKKIIWKTGIDPYLKQQYGTTTCLPVPTRELVGSS